MSETESPQPLFEEFSPVALEEWRRAVQTELGTDALDDFLEWSSLEGVTMPAYLQRDALDQLPHVDSEAAGPPLSDARDAPANQWTLCHPLEHPNLATVNEHARSAVEGGAHDLKLSLSSPPSHDTGLPLRSPNDLATVLDGIDLSATGLHLDGRLAAPVLYGAVREHLSGENVDRTRVHGSVLYDPVAALASGHAASDERAFALAHQLAADATELPGLRTTTIDARIYHDAGASAVQELALTLGALAERLDRGTERGRPLPALLDDLHVAVSVSTSYLVEIAKLRALRLLVPQVAQPFLSTAEADASFSPADLHLQAETSRRSETLYDPHMNMLRGTTEAMAAVLGGCDVLSVRPYDAALRPPDAFGSRIARNVQLILRHEAHLDQVADPAAGSYYLETLTDKLAQKAWTQFQDLEAEGGVVDALQAGTVQRRIEETRHDRLAAVDERKQVLVGTTQYPALDEQRHSDLVSTVPPDAGAAPASDAEPPSIDTLRQALRDGASPLELVARLDAEEPAVSPLPRIRVAAEIESIRLRTEQYADAHDGPPRVLLVPLGPPSLRSARATFARNFLGVAGLKIEEPLKFETVAEAADTAVETDADAVVLCSSNAEYADLAPSLASALEERDHDALLLIAGNPDDIDAGGQANLFVHKESPLKETLTTLQKHLGIPTGETP